MGWSSSNDHLGFRGLPLRDCYYQIAGALQSLHGKSEAVHKNPEIDYGCYKTRTPLHYLTYIYPAHSYLSMDPLPSP